MRGEGGSKRERGLFYLSFHSPNVHNSRARARSYPGAGELNLSLPYLVTGTQLLELPPTASYGAH